MDVVFQYVKDTIWKQITTNKSALIQVIQLFFNTSKIQFESKSQPNFGGRPLRLMLFFNTSKIQFESKSQLDGASKHTMKRCFSIRQRYNLKANHNCRGRVLHCHQVVFQYVKDTIWKQITTVLPAVCFVHRLFFNTSKIQFESKSQLISKRYFYNIVVFQYVKDTIWKQITTVRR